MADVASSFKNWSASSASNNPTSATVIGSGLAPNLQQIQATLRTELGSRSAPVTAASTVDLNSVDEGTVLVNHISGTVSISSFGTVQAGIKKLITFSVTAGTLTLVYNATSMILPAPSNITVSNGDSLLAESLGSGNWKVHIYSDFLSVVTAASDPTFAANNASPISSNWVLGRFGSLRHGITTFSSAYIPAGGELLFRAHGLGVTPQSVRLVFKCVVADAGYGVGTIVMPNGTWNGSQTGPLPSVFANPTNCAVQCSSGFLVYITNATTGAVQTPTASSWQYAFQYTY